MNIILDIKKPGETTYKIHGATLKDVLKAFKSRKWWGKYESKETASYVKDKTDSKLIGGIKVSAKPLITMPVWANYANGDPREKKSWDKMVAELKKHEMEHHTIFKECAAYWKDLMTDVEAMKKAEAVKEFNIFKKDTQGSQDALDKSKNSCANVELVYYEDAKPKK